MFFRPLLIGTAGKLLLCADRLSGRLCWQIESRQDGFGLAIGRHEYVRGIRSGCTNSLIAAGGILNAANYGRACTCNWPISTSLALVNMPEAAAWDLARKPPAHVKAGENP